MTAQAQGSRILPIRISPNGRHFLDATGAPFFWLGDTIWHLFRDYSPADAAAVLQNRKAKGFNALLIMLIGYESEPKPNIGGELPWLNSDPAQPNERYYQHVDQVMRLACDLDFIPVCGVYHKTQLKYYTPEKAQASARWIARRYKDIPNIIWSAYPEARQSDLAITRAIAAGLREGDGGSHLITIHPDPSPQSSRFVHEEPWLAFNTVQAWNDLQFVYSMTAADYGLTPLKPVIMGEGGYEASDHGRLITPADIRRQAYWTYLAGGYHVYGHVSNHNAPGLWKEWSDSPGSFQIATFKKIITSLKNWWEIIPDQSIFMTGTGSGLEINAAGHSRAADWALIYFSTRCTARIRMDRIKATERVQASWINPLDGVRTPLGAFAYSDVKEFTPPEGWEDALLILEAV